MIAWLVVRWSIVLQIVVLFAACGEQDPEDDVIDAGIDGATTCDPIAQMGCPGKGRCTWLYAQERPPAGVVTCAPNGTTALGGACTTPPAGPMGYDDCVRGAICVAGTCRPICDVSARTCEGARACVRIADVFADLPAVGACEP